MGDEKYAKALDKLIDAKDEIARLRAELAEAREVVGYFLANRGGIVVSSNQELAAETEMLSRARAFIDRGA